MAAVTATEHDRRTQLALWVGGRGEIEFAMGNERGKGVILGAGQFQEGVWTHLAVSVEGRKVRCGCGMMCMCVIFTSIARANRFTNEKTLALAWENSSSTVCVFVCVMVVGANV